MSRITIYQYVSDGILPAKRRGIKRVIKINIDKLREFASDRGIDFDEGLAQKYSEGDDQKNEKEEFTRNRRRLDSIVPAACVSALA